MRTYHTHGFATGPKQFSEGQIPGFQVDVGLGRECISLQALELGCLVERAYILEGR